MGCQSWMARCWVVVGNFVFVVVERLLVVGYSKLVPGLGSFVFVMVFAWWSRVVLVVDLLIELPVVSKVMPAFEVFGSRLLGGHAPQRTWFPAKPLMRHGPHQVGSHPQWLESTLRTPFA